MSKYEIMYILNNTLEEEKRKGQIEDLQSILEKNGAKNIKADEWGSRNLAYEIKKQTKGYYVVVTLESENSNAIDEFDRLALINKNILRHMIVKLPQGEK